MDRKKDEQEEGWMDRKKNEWTGRRMNRKKDRWTGRRIDGQDDYYIPPPLKHCLQGYNESIIEELHANNSSLSR